MVRSGVQCPLRGLRPGSRGHRRRSAALRILAGCLQFCRADANVATQRYVYIQCRICLRIIQYIYMYMHIDACALCVCVRGYAWFPISGLGLRQVQGLGSSAFAGFICFWADGSARLVPGWGLRVISIESSEPSLVYWYIPLHGKAIGPSNDDHLLAVP